MTPSTDSPPSATSWWSGPAGGREVLRIALPMIVATVSWTLMQFIDRMFLLWHSNAAMAAAMPAGMLHFSLLCFPLGLVSYANTFVAQYDGNGQPHRIGPVVWQAVWLAIAATPFCLLAIPLAPYVFQLAGHEPELLRLETIYFQVLAYGAGGALIGTALSTFYTGRGTTRVVMVVDSATALVNIVLDYCWIFGHAGFPAWGIEGAAWATVVALWFKVVVYLVLLAGPRYRALYNTHVRRLEPALMARMWRFGSPSGLQMLVEVSAITLFLLLIGELGEEAMVVTTLAFSVNSMAFVPLLGLGIAVTTMVGQQLGQDRPDLAARATWSSLRLALSYSGIMAALYLFLPDLFLAGHASGMDPENFAQLRRTTVVLLRFVACYALFDAMCITFVSALKGAGDMRFILTTTLFTATLPVLIGWAGVSLAGGGLIWCWYVITGWICSVGLIYTARFLQGRWRTMRVIDHPAPLPPDLMLAPEPAADPVLAADPAPASLEP